jgi:hypothetical protein
MNRTLLVVLAALAWPAAAGASTVTIGPPLPLSAPTVNGVPCPSLGPDCWYTNVELPPGGVVEAPQNGTITSWKAEGLAGRAEPVIIVQDPGMSMYSIVSEGQPVSEPCGGTPGLCNGGTTLSTFTADLTIAKGQFFAIRMISAAGCIAEPAGSGCSTIGGATDHGVHGGSGANTQPVGTPTSADNDPDATIAISAAEQLASSTSGGFGGVDLLGSMTQQVISAENGDDTRLRIACEQGAMAQLCSGIVSVQACPVNPQRAANKAAQCVDTLMRQSPDLATDAASEPAIKPIIAGKAGFRLAPGTQKTITIKLSKAATKLLAKQHKLDALIVATEHDGGKTKVTSRRVVLKLKR